MNRWLSRLVELEGAPSSGPEHRAPLVQIVQNVQASPSAGAFEQIEHIEQPSPSASAAGEARGEPAAQIEDGVRVPWDWAEGYARLRLLPPPRMISLAQWQTLIGAAGRFLNRWGAQAAALGWNAADIFGCHPEAPAVRYDLQGVVWLLGSGDVVAITDAKATVRHHLSGALLTFRRVDPAPGQLVVMAWDLVIGQADAS
jgi:hypothetical protein